VSLLEGAGQDRAPQETEATAGLDNHGIVQLQQSLMRQQDSQVEQLEQSVGNTRVCRWSIKPSS
jgi:syntaxin of plants SYP5